MIVYNSQKPLQFLRLRGSVIPRASRFAAFSGGLALVLKLLETSDILQIEYSKLVSDNAAVGMYSGTLAFLLVFRTSKCYSRFWHCATSCCTLRAQLLEAASSLICFTFMSSAPEADIEHFQKTVVSLTSLLHSAALGNVCCRQMDEFEVIGLNTLDARFRMLLAQHNSRERVDLVYMWMNGLVVRSLKCGLLNVPPPILSRVFQQIEKAMVEYNQVLEVMMIPFPFPYAQTAYFLLILLGLFTPFAMCSWTDHAASCGFLTFIAVLCLACLELIASELENPFGDDDNDLPVDSFQDALNESLTLVSGDSAKQTPQYHFEDLTVQHEMQVVIIAGKDIKSLPAVFV
jgi:predicted membrane chloride channel (bestrophin family)